MERYSEKVLSNGLTCKYSLNHHLTCFTIGIYIRAGLLQENDKCFGISHLLEHLFFRRLADLSQRELYFLMESMGTELRGKTFANGICFSLTVLPEYFDGAMQIIKRLFEDTTWSMEEIRREKKVVINQIEYQYYESFYKYADRVYFYETNYAQKIMATKSFVKNVSRKTLLEYKEKWISPGNSCMVVTGNFPVENPEKAEDILSTYKKGDSPDGVSVRYPRSFCERTEDDILIDNVEYEPSEILLSFDIPNGVEVFCAELINCFLGEGVGSRLSIALREELGLTNEILSTVENYYGFSRLTIKFMVDNPFVFKALEEAFKIISAVKYHISAEEYSISQLFCAKNRKMQLDDPYGLNFTFGYYGFLERRDFKSIEDLMQKYERISRDDLMDGAKLIFVPENLFVAVSSDKKVMSNKKILSKLIELRKSLSNDNSPQPYVETKITNVGLE